MNRDPKTSPAEHEAGGWRDWPSFRRMMQAQAAHAGGDALVAIALAGTLFFSVPLGEARAKVLLYLLLTMTPFAMLSPVVGPLLDRWVGAYRLAIVASSVGRAVLALYMATRTDAITLYPLAFGMLVLSRTHGVSRGALLPETLPPGRSLIAANSRLSVISVLGGAVAALPAIGIQKWLGPGATLRVAAVVFVLATAAALQLPRTRVRPRSEQVSGRVHVLLSPRLLAAGAATAASRAAIGFAIFLLAFVLRAEGESAKGFGAVLVAAGAGGFSGALAAPLLRRALRESLLMLASLGAMGAVSFLVAGRFGLGAAVFVALVTGFGASVARLAFDSLIQHEAPEEIRARTFARYETIFQMCWVGGAALAAAIPFGASFGLEVLGLISVGGIVFALWTAVGRPAPAEG